MTASSLQRALFLVLADSPYIHFYFNLSTTATATKASLTVKVTPRQRPVDQQLMNGVYRASIFIGKGHETWNFHTILLIYFDCDTMHFSKVKKFWTPEKTGVILHPNLSITPTSLLPLSPFPKVSVMRRNSMCTQQKCLRYCSAIWC